MKSAGEQAALDYYTDVDVDPGDVIQTSTGRRYLVVTATRTTGRQPHWRLTTQVMSPRDQIPPGAVTHRMRWNRRGR